MTVDSLKKERFARDERFDLLIASIREHNSINMKDWQVYNWRDFNRSIHRAPACSTFEQLHSCGNKACIAGHLALLPEFQATEHCIQDVETLRGSAAVSWWLESDIAGTIAVINGEVDTISEIRHKIEGWDRWGITEAVAALEALRNFDDIDNFEEHILGITES